MLFYRYFLRQKNQSKIPSFSLKLPQSPLKTLFICTFGRVVKANGLGPFGRKSAWVRTPQCAIIIVKNGA